MGSGGKMGSEDTSVAPLDRRVLVVGAASRDITAADPRGWRLGGAAAFATLALARLGIPVRGLIGVDEAASTAHELDLLRAAGAEIALARLTRGPVFENDDAPGGRVQRSHSWSTPLTPSALPRGWARREAAVIFAPVAGELDEAWAEVPPAAAFVALGWQGLLRRVRPDGLVERTPPMPHPLVARADLIVVSAGDLGPRWVAADLLAIVGPDATVVVTEATRGGRIARPVPSGARGDAPRWKGYRPIPSTREVDPTGAGDVFLATMVAVRVDPSTLGRPPGRAMDLRAAVAAASLAVEAPGLLGVPDLGSVLRRMRRRSTRTRAS
jgi:sugar/nucleoside kinase (ribokinase family)